MGRPGQEKGWKLKPWYSRTVLRAVCTWIVDQVTEVGWDKGTVGWYDGSPASASVSNYNKEEKQ